MNQPLLQIQDLEISFQKEKIFVPVIQKISYELFSNEILGIVGESGSGKSVSSLAIMGLLPKNISKITNGSIVFEGKNITVVNDKSFQKIRGNKIAMIFQEPMSSLNPSMKCGAQVVEILQQHTDLSKKKLPLKYFSYLKM